MSSTYSQRLGSSSQPLNEDEPLHTLATQHEKFTHLTALLKGEGLKGGGRRERTRAKEIDSDSETRANDSSYSHRARKDGRRTRAKK